MIYSLLIRTYGLLVRIVALRNPKARQWARGRRALLTTIANTLKPYERRVWFHCPSLGEFEQARPVIELYRQRYPDTKIVLTFYSPSGYEIRKNYPGADYIFYLPEDTRHNARRFVELVNPVEVYFVKYDFWKNYLKETARRGIPLYLFSAIFRPEQVFFRWYGGWYRQLLHCFSRIFVQNPESETLLGTIGVQHVTVAGDTRFDRVAAIAATARDIPPAEGFANNSPVLVAGSTWPADEQLLIHYLNENPGKIKLILAPHEIDPSHLKSIETLLGKIPFCRFSQWSEAKAQSARVLLIDNIGMLSSLYQYGTIAYIGGGFGKGIHNILEAATFGLPVVFGPNYQRFKEAADLVAQGGAWPISDYSGLKTVLHKLTADSEYLKTSGDKASTYVKSATGATLKILSTKN